MPEIELEGNNNEPPIYEQEFYEMIGKGIASGDYSISGNLKIYLKHVFNNGCPAANSKAVYQAYLLYSVCVNLVEYRKYFNTDDEFYSNLYMPYVYHILSEETADFRKMMLALESKAYSHISEKAATIIDFSLVLHNISKHIIKSDTQQIFFKTTFIEISPTELDRASDYFFSSLQYIYYNYIKSKTTGVIPIDSLLEVKNAICIKNESRYTIYDHGLRSYQIQRICSKSDTLRTISENFDELKTSIISNRLLYILKSSYFPEMKDEKALLLKANSSDFNLAVLETEVPLICRLLRAIHIKSDTSIHLNNPTIMYIKESLYSTINDWMLTRMSKDSSQEISAALSVSLSKEILTGSYVDPQSLLQIEFSGNVFATQFQRFIILMLERIMDNSGEHN